MFPPSVCLDVITRKARLSQCFSLKQSQANDDRFRESIDTGNTRTLDKHQLEAPRSSSGIRIARSRISSQLFRALFFFHRTPEARTIVFFVGGFKRLTYIPTVVSTEVASPHDLVGPPGWVSSQTLSSSPGWVLRVAPAHEYHGRGTRKVACKAAAATKLWRFYLCTLAHDTERKVTHRHQARRILRARRLSLPRRAASLWEYGLLKLLLTAASRSDDWSSRSYRKTIDHCTGDQYAKYFH